MKIKHLVILIMFTIISPLSQVNAQKFKDAGAYADYIEEHQRKVKKDFLYYNYAVIHNKDKAVVAARGNSFIKTLKKTQKKISAMPAFEGDLSLRDSASSYLELYYNVLTQKYNKFLDTEEIIEQSLDIVEAVLLAEELAKNKLDNAKLNLEKTKEIFAVKHQIKPLEKQETDLKFEETEILNDYFRTIYLIFLKSTRQEKLLWESLSKGNISVVEQKNYTLKKITEEGINQLKFIPAYKEDSTLLFACRTLLQFYQKESLAKIPFITDYIIKKERLERIDQAIVARNNPEENQNEMDLYNIAATEINDLSFDIDNDNLRLTAIRLQLSKNWFIESSKFLRRHTP